MHFMARISNSTRIQHLYDLLTSAYTHKLQKTEKWSLHRIHIKCDEWSYENDFYKVLSTPSTLILSCVKYWKVTLLVPNKKLHNRKDN